MSPPRLVLASASPRRTALLAMLGLAHEVVPADLDESLLPDESANYSAGVLACPLLSGNWALEPCPLRCHVRVGQLRLCL